MCNTRRASRSARVVRLAAAMDRTLVAVAGEAGLETETLERQGWAQKIAGQPLYPGPIVPGEVDG